MAQKILVIDDDEEYTAALACMLSNQGYEIQCAANGEDGLTLARDTMPDLILLDNMMTTEREGFEVARTLHQERQLQHIPVVMITATRQVMDLPFALQPSNDWLPVQAVLEKPVKVDLLLKTVKKYLRKKGA